MRELFASLGILAGLIVTKALLEDEPVDTLPTCPDYVPLEWVTA